MGEDTWNLGTLPSWASICCILILHVQWRVQGKSSCVTFMHWILTTLSGWVGYKRICLALGSVLHWKDRSWSWGFLLLGRTLTLKLRLHSGLAGPTFRTCSLPLPYYSTSLEHHVYFFPYMLIGENVDVKGDHLILKTSDPRSCETPSCSSQDMLLLCCLPCHGSEIGFHINTLHRPQPCVFQMKCLITKFN